MSAAHAAKCKSTPFTIAFCSSARRIGCHLTTYIPSVRSANLDVLIFRRCSRAFHLVVNIEQCELLFAYTMRFAEFRLFNGTRSTFAASTFLATTSIATHAFRHYEPLGRCSSTRMIVHIFAWCVSSHRVPRLCFSSTKFS